jgi:hypothetical protein
MGAHMRTNTPLGPLRPISFTASEIIARRIVTRLCQQPPYGLTWKAFAEREIARALAATMTRPTNRS